MAKITFDLEIPGFYYDKEKKRYFKIAPGHSGNQVTRETIAKKEAEEKRKTDVKTLLAPKPVIENKNTIRRVCVKNIVPLLEKVRTSCISCDELRSRWTQCCVSGLKPSGSQRLFDPQYIDLHDNLEHMHVMDIGKDHDELLGLWSLKETFLQRIQTLKLIETRRTWESIQKSLSIVANPHGRMLTQALNKVTALCWADMGNGRKHILYTTTCHTGYANSLAMIRNMESSEEAQRNSELELDFNLGKKASWSCAWNCRRRLFSVGSEKCALILNVERRTMWEYNTNISDPLTQAFSHQTGSHLYTGTRKGEILTHDLRSRSATSVARLCHKSSVCGLRLLQNDRHLVATDFTGAVLLWDLRNTRSSMVKYEGNVNMYTRLPVHIDETEKIVYTVGEDGYTRFWDLQQGRPLHTIPPPRPVSRETIPSVQFSTRWGNREGNLGLIMGLEHKLYFYGRCPLS